MALRKDYKQGDGTVVTGYFRVREVHTQYEKEKGVEAVRTHHFQVEVYNDETGEPIFDPDTRHEEGVCGYDLTIPTTAQVTSLIDRAYTHLKTLELFENAEDC